MSSLPMGSTLDALRLETNELSHFLSVSVLGDQRTLNGLLSSDLWSFRSPQRWIVFLPGATPKLEGKPTETTK